MTEDEKKQAFMEGFTMAASLTPYVAEVMSRRGAAWASSKARQGAVTAQREELERMQQVAVIPERVRFTLASPALHLALAVAGALILSSALT